MITLAAVVGTFIGFASGFWLGRRESKTRELVARLNARIYDDYKKLGGDR